MSDLPHLSAELKLWHQQNRKVSVFWRDDDAIDDTPALRKLLDIARESCVPVHISVIPATMTDDLICLLAKAPAGVTVLQHGFAHINYAPKGSGMAAELGDHRPLAVVMSELLSGRKKLEKAFGARFLPVMVPPWNRIAQDVRNALQDAGYSGISAADDDGYCNHRLQHTDAGYDPLNWKQGGAFKGCERVEAALVHMLSEQRKSGKKTGFIGLNTHHLAHDEAAWKFLSDFAICIYSHSVSEWYALASNNNVRS